MNNRHFRAIANLPERFSILSKRFRWTMALTIATPFLIIIAIVMGGGGHGNVEGVAMMFPLAFLVKDATDGSIPISMIFEFPVYGLIIDLSMIVFKKPLIGLIAVMVIHLLMVILALN